MITEYDAINSFNLLISAMYDLKNDAFVCNNRDIKITTKQINKFDDMCSKIAQLRGEFIALKNEIIKQNKA